MLIERDAELTVLAEAVRAACAGSGSLSLVRGPLGIGRSALLHAAGDLAVDQGMRVLRAGASPTEQDFADGVVRQLLEPVHDDPLADDGVDAVPQRWRRLAAQRPLALLVDDLQWADVESLHKLAYLVNRVSALPMAVVATVLDGDAGADRLAVDDLVRAAATTVRPRPLTVAGVRTFFSRRCGEPADETFAKECWSDTGGKPMFLGALAVGMLADGISPVAEQLAEARTLRPPEPSNRLARCLSCQPVRVTRFAMAMTALGEAATPAFVARLAQLDSVDFDEAERAMRRLGLVPEHGPLRYVDDAVADAVAGALSADEQDELHLRAAGVLFRGGGRLEDIAQRLLGTTSEPEPWATDVLRAAASAASARDDPEGAARYLRHALVHARARRGDLLADLVAVERGTDTAAAARHLRQALPLLETPVERAKALCLAPALAAADGRPDTGFVRRAVTELRAGPEDDPALAGHLEARLRLWTPYTAETGEDAAAWLHGEIAMDDPGQRELATVQLYFATLAETLPRATIVDLAHRVLEREPGGTAQLYTALPLLVPVLVAADATDGLESWLGAVTVRETPDLAASLVWTCQALLWSATGHLHVAKERALRALETASPDWVAVVGTCAPLLAILAMELRDPDLAARAERAWGPDRPSWALSLSHAAVAATSPGSADPAAAEYLADTGRQLRRTGLASSVLFPWRLRLAVRYERLGRNEQAAELIAAEYEQALGWGAPSALGRVLRMRGQRLDGGPGVRLLDESVQVLESSGNKLELAKSLMALGKRLGSPKGDASRRAGSKLAAQCGQAPVVAGPEQRTAAPAAVLHTVTTPLTRAELRIAELVVTGRRNKEIAAELGVTTRAIEKHLTSAYRKLGIDGRADLSHALPRGTAQQR